MFALRRRHSDILLLFNKIGNKIGAVLGAAYQTVARDLGVDIFEFEDPVKTGNGAGE